MAASENLMNNSDSKPMYRPIEPYIGPRPFRRDLKDQSLFFGRDVENDEIVALITSHRIILVYAQSGAGKTSVFNAQIFPSLVDYGFDVLPMARVTYTTPYTTPASSIDSNNITSQQIKNIYIHNALLSLLPEIDQQSIIDLSLFEFLDKYFPTHTEDNGELRPQVLIFDQLEELFSFYPDNWIEQQRAFFQQISDSLDNNPVLRIVLIIREDFLAQLDPFRNILPEKLRIQFRLERLRRKQAIQAVKGPLTNLIKDLSEDEKRNIESEVNELVNDLLKIYAEAPGGGTRQLEGEFIEPIQLQVVCRRWWHERGESNQVENRKAVMEDLGNVDKALEDFYENAVLSASKQTSVHGREIRIWCQKILITSSGTRSIVHRGYYATGGIDNAVVDSLESNYLIKREWRSGASWYELTHDRLIKPITSSNTKWKNVNEAKAKKLILEVVVPRLENQIMWYSRKARYNKTRYKTFQTIILVAGAMIPLINIVDFLDLSARIISSAVGLIIVGSIGKLNFEKYQESWKSYRSTAEVLKKEKYLFENNAGKYSHLDEGEKSQLASREVTIYPR